MSKPTSVLKSALLENMPRDLPMPAYRFQHDTGGSKLASSEPRTTQQSSLLRGCNFGG
jgi:hypothetical protein